jgi:hypothetical protein
MNTRQPPLGLDAPLGEILLAETAIRIELPPSKHNLACDRYEAVRNYIERDDSPLCGHVGYFYPQGSMAIRATIQSRKRGDNFDIDIVAELMVANELPPAQVLDLLYKAINGAPGSRYYGMVERQTRCVTVYYEDGMHLDITPSQLLNAQDPRRSCIFHAKPEEPSSLHKRLLMNSWAFCEHFNECTPADIDFAKAYGQRVRTRDGFMAQDEAEVKEVPGHSTAEGGKSATVVALQLMKCNRNILYAGRKDLRMPPSVVLAKIAAETSMPGSSISQALYTLSGAVLAALEAAEGRGALIDVQNPKCPGERFTDRWPENRAAQRLYIDDLKLFRRQLTALMSEEFTLDQKRDLLAKMFGEGPAVAVVKDYAERLGQSVRSGNRTIGSTGRIIPAAAASAAITAPAAAQPRGHTFYGERWKKR